MIKKRDFSPTGYLLAACATMLLFLTIPVGRNNEDAANPFIGPRHPFANLKWITARPAAWRRRT